MKPACVVTSLSGRPRSSDRPPALPGCGGISHAPGHNSPTAAGRPDLTPHAVDRGERPAASPSAGAEGPAGSPGLAGPMPATLGGRKSKQRRGRRSRHRQRGSRGAGWRAADYPGLLFGSLNPRPAGPLDFPPPAGGGGGAFERPPP